MSKKSDLSLRDLRQQVAAISCTDNCHCEGGSAARSNLLPNITLDCHAGLVLFLQ